MFLDTGSWDVSVAVRRHLSGPRSPKPSLNNQKSIYLSITADLDTTWHKKSKYQQNPSAVKQFSNWPWNYNIQSHRVALDKENNWKPHQTSKCGWCDRVFPPTASSWWNRSNSKLSTVSTEGCNKALGEVLLSLETNSFMLCDKCEICQILSIGNCLDM